MKYRLAAFDFDGTLADSGDWFLRVFNELADEFGFRRMAPGDEEKLRGYSAPEVIKYVGLPMWKLPRLMIATRKKAARDWRTIRLFDGVDEMLAGLQAAGVTVAVVSSNAEETIRKILGPQTSGKINHFTCGASLFGKASKLRALLRKAKVPAAESIYIGDEIRDAVASAEVGMHFGAVSWGYTKIESLMQHRPQMRFEAVEDILKVVD